MEILQLKNVSFTYPEYEGNITTALKNISLSINQGEFIVVMGESGCGKSTLLRLIKREGAPAGTNEGEIYYRGNKIEDIDDGTLAGDIGFVMQRPQTQIVTDKVYEELAFLPESLGMDSQKIRLKTGEMASFFGIEKLFRKSTYELSGGEMQMINLAAAMVMAPKVLLLDEPTSQLDPIAASEFISTLKKINEEMGTTIILVEHRLEEAFKVADKVLLMEEGRVLGFDTTRNIAKMLGNHKLLCCAPSAVKLYNMLKKDIENVNLKNVDLVNVDLIHEDTDNKYFENEDICPVSVKEGRDYLLKYSNNNETKKISENKDINLEQTSYIYSRDKEAEVILEAKDVFYRYEKNEEDVLRGINIKICEGEIYSLLGGNGTGKSTFLSIVSATNHPYRGKVLLHGKSIFKYRKGELYRNNIALLPQDPSCVFVESTIKEDYEKILKAIDYKGDTQSFIKKIAKQLGIHDLLSRHPYDLSGGEQQKCALGKLLLLEPKILLLDEPTKGIDGYGKTKLIDILKELKNTTTILMVTHDVEFAARVSNRCGLLFDGDIISEGSPMEFFKSNRFYTTAANRIANEIIGDVLTEEDIVSKIGRYKIVRKSNKK